MGLVMTTMMNGASLDHGGGRRADNATNSTDSALNDGRGEDHRTVNSTDAGANARAYGTANDAADNGTDWTSNAANGSATLRSALLGAADDALSMGGERYCESRHQRHGGRGKSG